MIRWSVIAIALAALPACSSNNNEFTRTDLVSDTPGLAPVIDPALVNPWGITVDANGEIWVANEGTGILTIYDGNGNPSAIQAPVPTGQPNTGIVFNSAGGLTINAGGETGSAAVITASLKGALTGVTPTTTKTLTAQAFIDTGASYTGLALSGDTTARLFAADFASGNVVLFDNNFVPMGIMKDPDLPAGFGPFGIQRIGKLIFVAYAAVGANGDEVRGAGLGIIDAFNFDGTFSRRISTGGELNAPWGMALAPDGFGELSGLLLVGNFGDGRIIAIDNNSGEQFPLVLGNNTVFQVDNLWGITFVDQTMFFAAGIGNELHGLFGRIDFSN